MIRPTLTVLRLGRVEYEDGLRLQELFGRARQAQQVGDVLLLLEHPPVLTLGRSGKRENILKDPEGLRALGVEVFETNRGGDVTYHGPGQVVGYPIFQLPPGRQDVRRYVRDVEEAMIRTAADYGIAAGRIPRLTGVWVGEEQDPAARKIAAIGVHIARWQTSHGFALNVNTDLSHFGLIIPCGIRGRGVTSLARELGRPVPVREVEDSLVRHFAELFEAEPLESKQALRTVSVTAVRGEGEEAEVLLLRRREDRGGFWQPVTGRVEPLETPLAAARREFGEETGHLLEVLPLDYVHQFAHGEQVPPLVVEETAFVARWPMEQTPTIDPQEHQEWRFFRKEEALAAVPHRGLKVAVEKALGPAGSASTR